MYQERRDPSRKKKKRENNDGNGVNLVKQNNMKNPQIVKYSNCYPEIFQPDFFWWAAAGHSKEKDIVLMIYICQRFYLSCNLHNINYQGLQQIWSYLEEAAALPDLFL